MSDEMIADLQRKLTAALQRIEDLEDWRSFHNGGDWGQQQMGAPHPNQSVNTAEYGGGVMRLDQSGIQIQAHNTTPAGISFLPAFSENPLNEPNSATVYGGVSDGNASSMYIGSTVGYSARYAYLGAVSGHSANAYIQLQATDGRVSSKLVTLTVGEGLTPASDTAHLTLNVPIWLLNDTADPSTVVYDGMLWYRTDIDKFRARINSVTENLATEAYVDSNAIRKSIVDAKGDLIAATAADTVARVAVGTNGQVLTADSAEAAGVKWTTVNSGYASHFLLMGA